MLFVSFWDIIVHPILRTLPPVKNKVEKFTPTEK
jgi:hypothetical protein